MHGGGIDLGGRRRISPPDPIATLSCYDNTFKVYVVYACCSVKDQDGLRRRLFANPSAQYVDSHGFCSVGAMTEEAGGGNLCFVWVDSSLSREDRLPALVHEMSHLADNIVAAAGIEDASGEVKAYLLGRETERIMGPLCGIGAKWLDPGGDLEKVDSILENYKKEASCH